MVLAKDAGKKPRELAESIAVKLRSDAKVASVEVAGPGFINLTLKPNVWSDELRLVLEAGRDYGRSDMGKSEKVNVEYVSANPTGPMHVGHGRGAVFGDALANLLAFAGYKVTRDQEVSAAAANDMLKVGGSKYRFNKNAVELRRLRTEVYWINEAGPGYNQQLVDNVQTFTFTEVYDYILELDGSGRVIGGEWVGGSRRRHPDFVWLPMSKKNTTTAGVRYDEVQQLMKQAGGGI